MLEKMGTPTWSSVRLEDKFLNYHMTEKYCFIYNLIVFDCKLLKHFNLHFTHIFSRYFIDRLR